MRRFQFTILSACLLSLFWGFAAYCETYKDLTLLERFQFDQKLSEFRKDPKKLRDILNKNGSFLGLPQSQLHQLFIDQGDLKGIQDEPHLVYDKQEEQGYFEGMKRAFEYLKSHLDGPISFDELIHLHDLAVEGVIRVREAENTENKVFKTGLSSGYWNYRLRSDEISTEARREWTEDQLILVPLKNTEEHLKLSGLFQTEIQTKLDVLNPHLPEEIQGYIRSLEPEWRRSFHQLLMHECIHYFRGELIQQKGGNTCFSTGDSYLGLVFQERIFDYPHVLEQDCARRVYLSCKKQDFLYSFYKSQLREEYLAYLEVMSPFEIEDEETVDFNLKIKSSLPFLVDLEKGVSQEPGKREYVAVSKKYLAVYQKLGDELSRVSSIQSSDEVLKSIAAFVRALLIFHIFPDGNGRTACFLVLNKLLIQNHFPPVILEDPHDFAGIKSKAELLIELKNGMYNFLREANQLN